MTLPRLDQPCRELRFRLERNRWEQDCRKDIAIDGLEPCLDLFGLG